MAKKYRIKCPKCGEITNLVGTDSCPKCGTRIDLEHAGMLHLYRMGNFLGSAAGFGLYINGEAYGHIGNKETLSIPLPYGHYTLHVVSGVSRKCNDPEFDLSEQEPTICMKVHLKPGVIRNSFVVERADPSTMPNID